MGARDYTTVEAILWGVVAAVAGSGVTGITTYNTRNVALPPKAYAGTPRR